MALEIDEAGVRFIIQNLEGYLDGMDKANRATEDVGTKTERSATKSGLAWNKIGKAALAAGAIVATAAAAMGVAVLKLAGDFDDAYDSIQVGTGATGEELGDLQASFDKVFRSIPADGGSVAKAMTAIAQKTGATGAPLETLTTQIVELSRITGTDLATNLETVLDATQRWGLSAEAAAPFLDHLFRVSQESGVPVSELAAALADNKSILDGLGLTLPESANLIGSLGKSGIDAGEAFGGLRIALTKFAKDGIKDPKAEIAAYFDRIKNAKTDAEAAAIGVAIFGKQAINLTSAIRDGTFNLKDFTAAVGANKNSITATAEETNDWREDLAILRNEALVRLKPILMDVFEAVGRAVNDTKPALEDFRRWWAREIEPPLQDIRRVIENDLIPAVRAILRVFEQIEGPIRRIVVDHIGDYVKGVVDIIAGVVTLISALFDGRWRDAWDSAARIAGGAFDVIAALPKAMFRLLDLAFGEGFRALMGKLAEWLDIFVVGPFERISGLAAAGKDLVADFAAAIRESLGELAGNVLDWATDVGAAIFNGAKSGLGDLGGAIWEWVRGALDNVIGLLEGGVNRVIGAVNDALEFTITIPTPLGDIEIPINPPDIPGVTLPRVSGSGATPPPAPAGASMGDQTYQLAGLLQAIVAGLGGALPARGSTLQGAPGGITYNVNATYANPQNPGSIRLDLIEMSMKAVA